jgi:hypothetical protein
LAFAAVVGSTAPDVVSVVASCCFFLQT